MSPSVHPSGTAAALASAFADRVRTAVVRANPWRITAVLAATVLGAVLWLAGPGSIEVLAHPPVTGLGARGSTPAWTRPCLRDLPTLGQQQLAFCARLDGRVVASQTKDRDGESHLLVIGGFHFTLVELPSGAHVPAWGSRITVVGPLFSGSYGLRELKAVWVGRR